MAIIMVRWGLVGFMMISVLALGSQAKAEEWKMEQGGIEPGQSHARHACRICPLDSVVDRWYFNRCGPLVNFQGMYSLNKWLLLGMMLEWERHGMNLERPRY